ncbi:MAG: hypothetical protein O2967_20895 [Proteobacteria bacterium]|nr:hypothetical protein [Pseudomonadota bacterium]
MRALLIATLTFIGFATVSLSSALGAPQMMGLVANNSAVPLQCDRGECFAELTAFCLQPLRSSPIRGTAYRLHDDTSLVAIATTNDGRTIQLDPGRDLRIKAERSHVAVRISLSAREMFRRNLREVHITVARNATLVPVAVSDDKTPLHQDEIAAAAGSLRAFGGDYVDREQKWMPVARMANRLINALPPGGQVGEQQRQALWAKAIGPDDFASLPAGTGQRLRMIYDECRTAVATARRPSLRRCLESKHDSMVGALNNQYWHAIKFGS